jgi:hypothetical protein
MANLRHDQERRQGLHEPVIVAWHPSDALVLNQ